MSCWPERGEHGAAPLGYSQTEVVGDGDHTGDKLGCGQAGHHGHPVVVVVAVFTVAVAVAVVPGNPFT